MTLKEIAERRKRTTEETSVVAEEVGKLVKSLNEITVTGNDLEAAGLLSEAEKHPELQAAVQDFRSVWGFKTQLEQAAMRFGRLQKRIPAMVKQCKTAPENLKEAIQVLSIQVRTFDKKVKKSGLTSEDIQELSAFEVKIADLEPQLEAVA